MIVYHQGREDNYTSKPYYFRKGVPTFIPKEMIPVIEQKGGNLAEYDPSKIASYRSGNIMVLISSRLELVVGSIGVVKRIIEGFPTCGVYVSCSWQYRSLFPKGVTFIDHYSPSDLRGFYRIYDLTAKSRSVKDRTAPINLGIQSYQQLLLQALDLYEHETDSIPDPYYIKYDKRKVDEPYIVMFRDKYAVMPVSNFLLKELENKYKIEIIESEKIEDFDKNLNLLNNSSFNIFCKDTPYSYLSASLGVPSIFFMSRPPFPSDRQYEKYDNFKLATPQSFGPSNYDKVLTKIKEMISESMSGSSFKKKTKPPKKDVESQIYAEDTTKMDVSEKHEDDSKPPDGTNIDIGKHRGRKKKKG